MNNDRKKQIYSLQLKALGIGLIIAIAIIAIIVLLDLINWEIGIGLILVVFAFEAVYFFILRDRTPAPLTQVSMRKGVEFIDDKGNAIKEIKPGMCKITTPDKKIKDNGDLK